MCKMLYIHETKLTVRYAETDKMGIVHHSNYYIYFEEARTEFIKSIGISYSEIEENNVLFPLIESKCKYIQSAKYEDKLIIKTWIGELTPVKAAFNYLVIGENNKKIAEGGTLHIFVNNAFKIINLKKKYGELFKKLQALL